MHHLVSNRIFSLYALVVLAFISMFAEHADAEDAAQHLLSSIHEVIGVPGMSAAVSHNGEVIWSGAVGYRDRHKIKPVNPDTKFRIASVSKLFTAALMLQAAEDGILDLDSDIKTYLPEWPSHNGAKITLRHLASHTSGIDHYSSGDRYNPAGFYQTLSDSISIFAHKPLLNPPGESYTYSSYGYALMGAVLETTTQNSFADNLSTKIIGPFHLKNTGPENVNALPTNTTQLFEQNGLSITRNDQSHVFGATGILSTPTDLVLFAYAYSAGHLVERKMVEMSWVPVQLKNGELAGTSRFKLGFGWRIGSDWSGDTVYHHAGTTPGARSILSINPTKKTAVALVSNAQWVSRIETTGELIATAATADSMKLVKACDQGTWQVAGVFIEDNDNLPAENNEMGTVTIQETDGICIGRLSPTDALATWLVERGSKTTHIPLTLVAVENATTSVYAAATPWGAFPLKASTSSDSFTITGDFAGRKVSLSTPATGQSQ